jgi:hypothetical protein
LDIIEDALGNRGKFIPSDTAKYPGKVVFKDREVV